MIVSWSTFFKSQGRADRCEFEGGVNLSVLITEARVERRRETLRRLAAIKQGIVLLEWLSTHQKLCPLK